MLIVIVSFVLLVGCLFILKREKRKQEQKQDFDSGWDEPEYIPKSEGDYDCKDRKRHNHRLYCYHEQLQHH